MSTNNIFIKNINVANLQEYDYIYDDGKLSSCVEYNITIGSDEIITSRTKVCHVVTAYNEEGTLEGKTITLFEGSNREITYSLGDNTEKTVCA